MYRSQSPFKSTTVRNGFSGSICAITILIFPEASVFDAHCITNSIARGQGPSTLKVWRKQILRQNLIASDLISSPLRSLNGDRKDCQRCLLAVQVAMD